MLNDLKVSKSRLSILLTARYNIVGVVPHITGLCAASALMAIVGNDVLCIAPKVLHETFKDTNPEANITSPQMYIKDPPEADIIICFYLHCQFKGFKELATTVFRRKV